MTEAPERAGIDWTGDNDPVDLSHLVPGVDPHPAFTPYVRLDLYESERALNAELVAALRGIVKEWCTDEWGMYWQVEKAADEVEAIHAALAKAEEREKGENQ